MGHGRMALWLPIALIGCKGGGITIDEDTDGAVVDGDIAVAPDTIDLGTIFVGQTATAEITVTNLGREDADVSLSIIGSSATAYAIAPYTSSPASGETATHTLTLTPTTWGDHSISVMVEDAVSDGKVEIPVTARVMEDADGDGFASVQSGGDDCDDTNNAINPGAAETWYDGIDSDCDGGDDYDQDGDGHKAGAFGGDDCDDTRADAYPGASEVWYDGVDQDCLGGDDYDQDGDGFQSDAHGGTDCDDTDAAINPDADEVWYDGVDASCSGDDYDQDGDGHQSDGYGGDDCDDLDPDVSPSADEIWYDGDDQNCDGANDYDQDGDGVEVDTDCNDEDATITEPSAETLDGRDEDCNGLVDDFPVDDVLTGVIYGYTNYQYLGNIGAISMSSDVTGDGGADVILATSSGYQSGAWVVSGASVATANGGVDDYDVAMFTGESSSYPLALMTQAMGDVDDDGTADVLFAGSRSGGSSGATGRAYLFEGGSGLTGTIAVTSAVASFNGDSSSDGLRWAGSADVDGDGVDDVAVGAPYDSDSDGGATASGNVSIFSGGAFAGYYDLQDADDQIHGESAYDYFGYSLVVVDLDDDGYADVLAGAPYDDEGGSNAGAVYVIPGNSGLSWGANADDDAVAKIIGDQTNLALGTDALAQPGDHDGDGNLDLVLQNEPYGMFWVLMDGGSLSGSVSVEDADHIGTGDYGDFGTALALTSDLDGDGKDEIVVGGDGADHAGSNAGAVYVYSWSSSWGVDLAPEDASRVFLGANAEDYFGTGLASGADLDGDGTEDLLIGAAQNDDGVTEGGAVYFIAGW